MVDIQNPAWRLIEVNDVEFTPDDSGVYVIINRVCTQQIHKEYAGEIVRVRADLMQSGTHEPIVSFIGKADNVRKHLIRFLQEHFGGLNHPSMEHASYIGWELHRAEVDPNYVQE